MRIVSVKFLPCVSCSRCVIRPRLGCPPSALNLRRHPRAPDRTGRHFEPGPQPILRKLRAPYQPAHRASQEQRAIELPALLNETAALRTMASTSRKCAYSVLSLILAAVCLVVYHLLADYPPGSLSFADIMNGDKRPLGAWGAPVKKGHHMPLNKTSKVLVTGAAGFIGMVSTHGEESSFGT